MMVMDYRKKVWIEKLVGESGTGIAQMDEAEEPATGVTLSRIGDG